MPFSFTQEADHAKLTFFGQVTVEDLKASSAELFKVDEGMEVSPNRLSELSGITGISLDFQAMHTFATVRMSAKPRNSVRSALVAPSELQYNFARLFQSLNMHPQIEVRVFRDPASALAWIRGIV
jgi:hypothetical protein